MTIFLKYYNNAITILCLAVLGGICGYLFKDNIYFLKPFGDLFITLIKMMLVPLIFFTVMSSTASLSNHHNALNLGIFSFAYFFLSSFFAGLAGVVVALFMKPGIGKIILPPELTTLPPSLSNIGNTQMVGFWDFVFGVIPQNPIKALTETNVIPILFFAIFMGIALSCSKNKDKDILVKGIATVNEAFIWMIGKIMYIAPIAVFSLMAYFVGSTGLEIIYLVAKLVIAILIGLFIWIYIFLGGFVAIFSKSSYLQFIRALAPVQIFAMSTSSSIVTLPKNMNACNELNVDKDISNFILPMGATLNMNGSAMYYSIVTIFFAQMFGVNIEFHTYFLIAFTAALGSMATPGVPGLSVTIIMVMLVANVPIIGYPLIIAIDRVLDMFITTCNVVGDTSCATVANRFFGRNQVKTLD